MPVADTLLDITPDAGKLPDFFNRANPCRASFSPFTKPLADADVLPYRLGRSWNTDASAGPACKVSALSFGAWGHFRTANHARNRLGPDDDPRSRAALISSITPRLTPPGKRRSSWAKSSRKRVGRAASSSCRARCSGAAINPIRRASAASTSWKRGHAAMERLKVDYLDLYFCHRPDPHTPI